MEKLNQPDPLTQEKSESQNPELLDLANLLDKQIAYIQFEIEDNWQETGHYGSLRRFRILAEDHGSVLHHLKGHWNGFRYYDEELSDLLAQNCSKEDNSVAEASQKALGYLGKTAASVADKLGLALWLEDRDQNNYTDVSLQLISMATKNKLISAPSFDYESQLSQKFEDTCIGFRIGHMYEIIRTTPDNFLYSSRNTLIRLSKEAAVHSLRIWQTYVKHLEDLGLDVILPEPGTPLQSN